MPRAYGARIICRQMVEQFGFEAARSNHETTRTAAARQLVLPRPPRSCALECLKSPGSIALIYP
ncbi:MAG: hypothetical protein ACRECE_11475, partial [Xanthobacteraceae bacterium]